MSTLLLRFAAPQQSWGSSDGVDVRPTDLQPTRSGVVGLLCAALGNARGDIPEWMDELDILVRVDEPGRVEVDFHTVSPPPADIVDTRTRRGLLRGAKLSQRPADWVVPTMSGGIWNPGGGAVSTLITHRHYLAGAEFLVAITGAPEHVETLREAMRAPVFPPYLGRKAYAPTFPLHLGVHEAEPFELLSVHPTTSARERLRIIPASGGSGRQVTPPRTESHLT